MPRSSSSDGYAIRRALDALTVVCGLGILGLLFFEFGFPQDAEATRWIIPVIRSVLWVVVILQLVRAIHAADWLRDFGDGVASTATQGVMLLLLALEPVLISQLHGWFGEAGVANWEVVYLTTLHVLVLGLLARRLLNFNQLLAFVRVSPRVILITSYVGLILVGTALLKLPNATTTTLNWLDALFTSTSAVCVTGLIVVDTATVFTPLGHGVILLLFQLGGLGLMTFTYFFVALFGSGITIKDRALLLEFLNEEYVGRVTSSLMAIVIMTLVFEGVGAVLLYVALPGDWFAHVFHSVSAFCNAGFSLYTAGLYDPLTRANLPFQVVIMLLIILGGLGFPVLKNLWDRVVGRLRHRRQRSPRLTTHTKLVLVTTAALVFGGALIIYVLEFPVALRTGEAPHWFGALFTSVTTRTAGFNTVPVEALLMPTVFVLIVLMFIGGSPASTAGGIKTTTFAVALLNTLRILRDPSRELVAFRRQIPSSVASRAFAVSLLALAWVTCSTVILAWTMPEKNALDVAFEAVSAFSTVGLTRGLTADLTPLGKGVIIASMLVGRIGILYVALGIVRKERPGRISYPEGNIIIS